eukprot:scaffold5635_cov140-Skeletonema_dohrnii-CCMP3373.AAC.7
MSGASRIEYSEKYADEENEYRSACPFPTMRALFEIFTQQHASNGRYLPDVYKSEATTGIRPVLTGAIDPELKRMALEEYKGQFGLRGH